MFQSFQARRLERFGETSFHLLDDMSHLLFDVPHESLSEHHEALAEIFCGFIQVTSASLNLQLDQIKTLKCRAKPVTNQ